MPIIRAQVWSGKPKEVKYWQVIEDKYNPTIQLRDYMKSNPIFAEDLEYSIEYAGKIKGPYKFRKMEYLEDFEAVPVSIGVDEFTLEEAGFSQ